MTARGICTMLAMAGALGVSSSAQAEILSSAPAGFAVSHEKTVAAKPEAVWKALLAPATWWSGAHSWSGDADNFTLSPTKGGCLCETLPNGGFAEHARVIHVAPCKVLRLSGALGPLQPEALTGTLTISLKPADNGTSIRFDYVVGGFARFDLAGLAPAVDGVIGEQHRRLVTLIETGRAGPKPAN